MARLDRSGRQCFAPVRDAIVEAGGADEIGHVIGQVERFEDLEAESRLAVLLPCSLKLAARVAKAAVPRSRL